MATKTRDQLVDRALQKLMIVGSGQSPDAEDQELVDGIVDATLGDLQERNVVLIEDDEAIPASVFEWVADCLADNAAADFGKPRDPQKVMYAENRLKKISSIPQTYEPLRSEYF